MVFVLKSVASAAIVVSLCTASPTHQHHSKRAYSTPIDVAGTHAWQAPSSSDQRGPCPALNALANHGYISRNGVVTPAEAVLAANSVFGLGLDLATILATLGVVFGGAPLALVPKFSIAGQDRAVSNALNGLLGVTGMPQGLNLTHNIIEADSSPTRDDLYETGDAWTLNMNHFRDLLAIVPEGGTLDNPSASMATFATKRLHQTIASNPSFYYGPFSGLVARNAGFLFIANLLSNHSSAQPEGQLTEEILKSFFAITGSGSAMTYSYGRERIPSNFYRRAADYTLLDVNLEVIEWAAAHPELANIGGNTGTVNSFTGVDLNNLSSGVLNAATLLQGNNLICFALNVVKLAAPSYTNNLFKTLSGPLNLVLGAVNAPLLSLNCPGWAALQSGGQHIFDVLKEYQLPGANQGLI